MEFMSWSEAMATWEIPLLLVLSFSRSHYNPGTHSKLGFDPIFYLHHCNVDRMISLWSAIHPGVWVSPNESEDGTFTIPPGTPVDTNTCE